MNGVQVHISAELMEQMFLFDRAGVRITGAWYLSIPTATAEPTGQVVLLVDAPDAPAGTRYMEPTYARADDGTVRMANPGWTPGPHAHELDRLSRDPVV